MIKITIVLSLLTIVLILLAEQGVEKENTLMEIRCDIESMEMDTLRFKKMVDYVDHEAYCLRKRLEGK